MRCNPAGEQCSLVWLGQALQESLQSHLVHKSLGDGTPHDTLPAGQIIEQVGALEFGLQVVESAGQLIGDGGTGLRSLEPRMLFPDALEFCSGVLRDLSLDVLDIALIEWRRLSVFENHVVDVLLGGQSQTGENFKRGARHTAWRKTVSSQRLGIIRSNIPLLALESLKRTTLRFSRCRRAC